MRNFPHHANDLFFFFSSRRRHTRSLCDWSSDVCSSDLANVYLHHVFDLWAARWRRREATGDMIIVRYADDIVVGFEHEADARRFREAMRERLQEFALSLHPDKTRLIEFGRDWARAKLREIKVKLRWRMHQPIPEQGRWLRQVVTGFFAYHAVPTNGRALAAFRYHVLDLWRRTLRRRSQKDGATWERIAKIADDWLPKPRVLHPWPQQRYAVKHPRWEPDAGMPHVRI